MTRTHRRFALAAVALLVGSLGAVAQTAPQSPNRPSQTPRLAITNASDQLIDELKVSASSTDQWGEDLLGRLQLAPRGTVFVNFPQGAECTQDVLVRYHNDTVETAGRVDACAPGATVTFDGSRARPMTSAR